jgi:O-antigen ligase
MDGLAFMVPILIVSTLLGAGIVLAANLGNKWLALTIIAYFGIATGILFKDKRLFVIYLVAACVPIGFQYNVWSHGSKFSFIEHFGGALNEPVINLVDLPIALLFLVWIIDLRIGRVKLPFWTHMDSLICCLLGWSLFSIYNTESYLFLVFEVLRYLKYFALYWMLRTYLDKPAFFWGILTVSVSLLALQGLVSLMQYFLYFQFPIPVGGVSGTSVDMVDNEIIQRVTGILGHSNTFSAYLSVICSICLILLFTRIRNIYKLAVLPLFLAGLLSLILTFSRNGWMVFALNALGIGYWAMMTKRVKAGHIVSLGCACVFLLGILFASGVFDTILTRVFRTDAKAFDSRADLVLVAWEMIQAHPVIGIGLNSFEENMIHYDPYHITHIIRQPVHNGFLLVAAETGIPALLFLLALVAGYIRMSVAILRKNSELHFAVGLTGLITFAGLGISNLFDVTLRKESISGTIVLVAAMVVALHWMDRKKENSGLEPSEMPLGKSV